jgi:phosphopantothenoylcysteine decarboxylase/phosphopantothenate--cysteine ligase
MDPVRFISNRSTGKQGLAIAQAALDAGAQVTLVHGPIFEPIPFGAETVPVQTTQEMGDAVLETAKDADALFMVAAVADFRPNAQSDKKIKKTDEQWGLAIGLEVTLDILTAVKGQRDKSGYPRVVLGFAVATRSARRTTGAGRSARASRTCSRCRSWADGTGSRSGPNCGRTWRISRSHARAPASS